MYSIPPPLHTINTHFIFDVIICKHDSLKVVIGHPQYDALLQV